MKKLIKNIAVLLIVITVTVSLSGCSLVTEARNSQAFYGTNQDGISSIKYGNQEYYLLPSTELLSPTIDDDADYIYATKPDVPVLLSFFLGDAYSLSTDGAILIHNDESSLYYCRSDKYEEISDIINNGFVPEKYCYIYYGYDVLEDNFTEKKVLLTDSEQAALEKAMSEGEFSTLPEMAEVTYDYSVNLYQCTEDMLFTEYYLDLIILENKYYLQAYDGEVDYIMEIDEPYKSALSGIANAIIESDNAYNDYWSDDWLEYEEY